jgi:large subunit ribosomal protein L4
MRRQAMLSVLSDKAREDQLVVLEALDLDEAKTREMVRMLSDVGAGPSVLLLGDGAGPGVLRCARNIQRTKTIPAYQLNAIDLLRHQSVVMTLEAVSTIEALWGGTVKGGRKAYEPAVESEEAAA